MVLVVVNDTTTKKEAKLDEKTETKQEKPGKS